MGLPRPRLQLESHMTSLVRSAFLAWLRMKFICHKRSKTIQATAELVDECINFYNCKRIQLNTKTTPMEMRLGTVA